MGSEWRCGVGKEMVMPFNVIVFDNTDSDYLDACFA